MTKKPATRNPIDEFLALPAEEIKAQLIEALNLDKLRLAVITTDDDTTEVSIISQAIVNIFREQTVRGPNKELVEHAVKEQKRKGGRNRWSTDPDKTCKDYESALSSGLSHEESLKQVRARRADVDRSTVYRHLGEGSEIYRKNIAKK